MLHHVVDADGTNHTPADGGHVLVDVHDGSIRYQQCDSPHSRVAIGSTTLRFGPLHVIGMDCMFRSWAIPGGFPFVGTATWRIDRAGLTITTANGRAFVFVPVVPAA